MDLNDFWESRLGPYFSWLECVLLIFPSIVGLSLFYPVLIDINLRMSSVGDVPNSFSLAPCNPNPSHHRWCTSAGKTQNLSDCMKLRISLPSPKSRNLCHQSVISMNTIYSNSMACRPSNFKGRTVPNSFHLFSRCVFQFLGTDPTKSGNPRHSLHSCPWPPNTLAPWPLKSNLAGWTTLDAQQRRRVHRCG